MLRFALVAAAALACASAAHAEIRPVSTETLTTLPALDTLSMRDARFFKAANGSQMMCASYRARLPSGRYTAWRTLATDQRGNTLADLTDSDSGAKTLCDRASTVMTAFDPKYHGLNGVIPAYTYASGSSFGPADRTGHLPPAR